MKTYKIFLFSFVLSGCAYSSDFVENDAKYAPTCSQLREVFKASKDDFDLIRGGVEITTRTSSYKTWQSSVVLRGADSCVIRKISSMPEYYCRWNAGDNRALMGAYYRSISEQLKNCVKVARVSQNDRGGRTSARVEIDEDDSATYSVVAQYERSPYYVYLTVYKY